MQCIFFVYCYIAILYELTERSSKNIGPLCVVKQSGDNFTQKASLQIYLSRIRFEQKVYNRWSIRQKKSVHLEKEFLADKGFC